jgi:hypothetical protein
LGFRRKIPTGKHEEDEKHEKSFVDSCSSSASCFPVGILPLWLKFNKILKKSLAPYRESEMIPVPCETGEAV